MLIKGELWNYRCTKHLVRVLKWCNLPVCPDRCVLKSRVNSRWSCNSCNSSTYLYWCMFANKYNLRINIKYKISRECASDFSQYILRLLLFSIEWMAEFDFNSIKTDFSSIGFFMSENTSPIDRYFHSSATLIYIENELTTTHGTRMHTLSYHSNHM
jgi:hypothetical protein